jgi:hypothetical protein
MTHFCIIGEAKCGTTSMWRYLAEHPEIALSQRKETNFFRSALFDWKNERRLRNQLRHLCLEICSYQRLLRSIVRSRYFQVCRRQPGFVSGDGSINYFHEEGMARRMRTYLPRARLILMLRNPVDRMYSNFWMNVRRGGAALRYASFEDFVDQGGWYRPPNLYAENLRQWLAHFPLQQFFLIKSEEFFQDPQVVLDVLFDFLGVKQHSYARRIHETPVAERAHQYPPMKDQTRERVKDLLSYQQVHLLELTGKNFAWFSN